MLSISHVRVTVLQKNTLSIHPEHRPRPYTHPNPARAFNRRRRPQSPTPRPRAPASLQPPARPRAVPSTTAGGPNHRRPVPERALFLHHCRRPQSSTPRPRAPASPQSPASPQPDRHPRCAARPHPEHLRHPRRSPSPTPRVVPGTAVVGVRGVRLRRYEPTAGHPEHRPPERYSSLNNLRACLLPTNSVHGAGHSDPTALQISPLSHIKVLISHPSSSYLVVL
jgi:hypothetical protein